MVTRFRLPASGAPAVSPALQAYTHNAPATVRTVLPLTDATALTTVAYTPDAADHLVAGDSLHRQFVSAPMTAGNVFTVGNVVKYAIQCLEDNAADNLNLQCFIGVVDATGAIARATLLTKTLEPTELAAVITNRFHSTTLTGSYTTETGDRLVVEFSVQGTPVGVGGRHNASLRWGSNGAGGDLGENDTDVAATLNPWIEFTTTIAFQGGGLLEPTGADGLTTGVGIFGGSGLARAMRLFALFLTMLGL